MKRLFLSLSLSLNRDCNSINLTWELCASSSESLSIDVIIRYSGYTLALNNVCEERQVGRGNFTITIITTISVCTFRWNQRDYIPLTWITKSHFQWLEEISEGINSMKFEEILCNLQRLFSKNFNQTLKSTWGKSNSGWWSGAIWIGENEPNFINISIIHSEIVAQKCSVL